MCRWRIKAVVKQHWPCCQWCNISCTILRSESIFLRKNVYLRKRGPKLNTRLGNPRITQPNQILKKICNSLDEQTEPFYSEWASCKNAEKDLNIYCVRWMKKQLEQHYQNSIFLNQTTRRWFVLQIWQVPYCQSNGTNIRKKEF